MAESIGIRSCTRGINIIVSGVWGDKSASFGEPLAHLEMLHGVDAHLVHDRLRLLAEHFDEADVRLGVEIRHEHAVAEHSVQQAVLRPAGDAVLASAGLLVREAEQRAVGGLEQLDRLGLGRQAGEEGEGREDGVFEDLG
jgi:hypothetical protein